jgi:hypothetical protein
MKTIHMLGVQWQYPIRTCMAQDLDVHSQTLRQSNTYHVHAYIHIYMPVDISVFLLPKIGPHACMHIHVYYVLPLKPKNGLQEEEVPRKKAPRSTTLCTYVHEYTYHFRVHMSGHGTATSLACSTMHACHGARQVSLHFAKESRKIFKRRTKQT